MTVQGVPLNCDRQAGHHGPCRVDSNVFAVDAARKHRARRARRALLRRQVEAAELQALMLSTHHFNTLQGPTRTRDYATIVRAAETIALRVARRVNRPRKKGP